MEKHSYKVNDLMKIPLHVEKWTDSMEQTPSWEANNHSTSQEIPSLLCNPKVHYHVHKSMPVVKVWTTHFYTDIKLWLLR
jgi:hypothetical protein